MASCFGGPAGAEVKRFPARFRRYRIRTLIIAAALVAFLLTAARMLGLDVLPSRFAFSTAWVAEPQTAPPKQQRIPSPERGVIKQPGATPQESVDIKTTACPEGAQ